MVLNERLGYGVALPPLPQKKIHRSVLDGL